MHVRCLLCNEILKCKQDTTQLLLHVQNKHPDVKLSKIHDQSIDSDSNTELLHSVTNYHSSHNNSNLKNEQPKLFNPVKSRKPISSNHSLIHRSNESSIANSIQSDRRFRESFNNKFGIIYNPSKSINDKSKNGLNDSIRSEFDFIDKNLSNNSSKIGKISGPRKSVTPIKPSTITTYPNTENIESDKYINQIHSDEAKLLKLVDRSNTEKMSLIHGSLDDNRFLSNEYDTQASCSKNANKPSANLTSENVTYSTDIPENNKKSVNDYYSSKKPLDRNNSIRETTQNKDKSLNKDIHQKLLEKGSKDKQKLSNNESNKRLPSRRNSKKETSKLLNTIYSAKLPKYSYSSRRSSKNVSEAPSKNSQSNENHPESSRMISTPINNELVHDSDNNKISDDDIELRTKTYLTENEISKPPARMQPENDKVKKLSNMPPLTYISQSLNATKCQENNNNDKLSSIAVFNNSLTYRSSERCNYVKNDEITEKSEKDEFVFVPSTSLSSMKPRNIARKSLPDRKTELADQLRNNSRLQKQTLSESNLAPFTSSKENPDNLANRLYCYCKQNLVDSAEKPKLPETQSIKKNNKLRRTKTRLKTYKTSVEKWKRSSGLIVTCPKCGKTKNATIKTSAFKINHSAFGAAAILACWPFCFLPCICPTSTTKNEESVHCSVCQQYLGVYDRNKNFIQVKN